MNTILRDFYYGIRIGVRVVIPLAVIVIMLGILR